MGDALSEIFDDRELTRSSNLAGTASPENLFSILELLEDDAARSIPPIFCPFDQPAVLVSPNATGDFIRRADTDEDEDDEAGARRKKIKLDGTAATSSHITVERNRRKQMNEHLSVLRSLMPCFYVKRGDQASIIGGVVDYIKELQQVLQSLEAKKQRKVYSPRTAGSPRPPLPPAASPRLSPLCSPRLVLPISPSTPPPGSPYRPRIQQTHEASPPLEASAEVAACSKSPVARVEVKFAGPNLVLKTVSNRIPGQAVKIIAVLEGLALEIIRVTISTVEDALLFSFTVKIGIECELSAEELAEEVQRTFSHIYN
ncbi:Transcription factor SPEECHLESS [Apostasia shenzhenica]|uniref:Transcription factor SPEECHLESS n=1 Tax=Apostasia shenzhenica TaxID=1088818 RepID=A0A2I0ATV9_9ASPA|nr:Transcription factor SPEECHLESS [Apostasia shenzhenica]